MISFPDVLDKGEFLQAFKAKHKLTHARLAQICGVSEKSVQRWFGSFTKSKTPTASTCKLLWLLDHLEKEGIEIPEIPDFE